MAIEDDRATEADWLEGLPLPREQTELIGHSVAAAELHEGYVGGRLHHAILLTGPKGIGKATLAFRFARFVLSHPDPTTAPPPAAGLLPTSDRVAAMVATGAHPNLLHLRRPWDDKAKKVKTQLTVDEIRKTVTFFGNAAGIDGYRIAIVDAADDMNVSAANALLKMLEEPPKRSLFLVLSHAPGRLLPTIRSRCRRLSLDPLGSDDLDAALTSLGLTVAEGDKRRWLPWRKARCDAPSNASKMTGSKSTVSSGRLPTDFRASTGHAFIALPTRSPAARAPIVSTFAPISPVAGSPSICA